MLLAPHRPAWLADRAAGIVWCETASQLAVLARHGAVRAAVVDALLAGLDAEVIGLVRRACPVLVVDDRGPSDRWVAAGASVIPAMPGDQGSLLAAVERAESAARNSMPTGAPSRRRGVLLTILAAPGGDGTAGATSTARALAATGTGPGPVVLADLTLDAPHRALHGLTPDQPGLPHLIDAGRFGPPPPSPTIRARHPTRQGYLVVPGLLHHSDWVTVGDHAAGSALDAIRAGAELVVAHVDRDLEGETDTGSFDIEDRNVLARTAVQASDLVLVAVGSDRPGGLGALAVLDALARFGVAHDRIAVVRPAGRRPWPAAGGRLRSPQILQLRHGARPDARLAAAIRARLAAVGPADGSQRSDGNEPRRIVPGSLGSWGHDIDGWITPNVPQQP
ncbi:hypothetical protein ACE2AJ_20305 [Aquihabitans daechungensis]|uniref:hypothetical protein n=1 Tax=Aquihabitans daechungensis TaxID=1052257 RepID=UPI003BA2068E